MLGLTPSSFDPHFDQCRWYADEKPMMKCWWNADDMKNLNQTHVRRPGMLSTSFLKIWGLTHHCQGVQSALFNLLAATGVYIFVGNIAAAPPNDIQWNAVIGGLVPASCHTFLLAFLSQHQQRIESLCDCCWGQHSHCHKPYNQHAWNQLSSNCGSNLSSQLWCQHCSADVVNIPKVE